MKIRKEIKKTTEEGNKKQMIRDLKSFLGKLQKPYIKMNLEHGEGLKSYVYHKNTQRIFLGFANGKVLLFYLKTLK